MSAIASQITSLTTVYVTVYPYADQRKHQSSASLAFVRGIHRRPVNSPHKGPVTRKMYPFDDVIMIRSRSSWCKVLRLWMEICGVPSTSPLHGVVCLLGYKSLVYCVYWSRKLCRTYLSCCTLYVVWVHFHQHKSLFFAVSLLGFCGVHSCVTCGVIRSGDNA